MKYLEVEVESIIIPRLVATYETTPREVQGGSKKTVSPREGNIPCRILNHLESLERVSRKKHLRLGDVKCIPSTELKC